MKEWTEVAPSEVPVVGGLSRHWNHLHWCCCYWTRSLEAVREMSMATAGQHSLTAMMYFGGIDLHPFELVVRNDSYFPDSKCPCLKGDSSCPLFTIFYN